VPEASMLTTTPPKPLEPLCYSQIEGNKLPATANSIPLHGAHETHHAPSLLHNLTWIQDASTEACRAQCWIYVQNNSAGVETRKSALTTGTTYQPRGTSASGPPDMRCSRSASRPLTGWHRCTGRAQHRTSNSSLYSHSNFCPKW
jgi:hypothetical protein